MGPPISTLYSPFPLCYTHLVFPRSPALYLIYFSLCSYTLFALFGFPSYFLSSSLIAFGIGFLVRLLEIYSSRFNPPSL